MRDALLAIVTMTGLLALGTAQADEPRNYYKEPRSYGTTRETDPPRYVRTMSESGIKGYEDVDWLDFGADYRVRYEYRDNDYRRSVSTVDHPFLLRSRAYFGVKNILDPLRFVVEFEDARLRNSQFADNDRDVNELEFIQLFGELYMADALGDDRPLSIRAGRQAFEFLDRRLIGRNEWRNTTNNFQGIRATLGQERNDWQLNLLALQPINRFFQRFDEVNDRQWFFGGIGHWRRHSDIITLEPFYLGLHQNGDNAGVTDRLIHAPGLRGYGLFGQSGFDYDFIAVPQFGRDDGRRHRAFGGVVEIGYRWEHEWKPRVSTSYGYGSGDKNPTDNRSQRFERFFGFARPWSNNDYFQWENLHAPKLRLEFEPAPKLRIDTGYNGYWLASDTDRWNNAGLRDTTGQSGDFIGHEFDMRVRYPLTKHLFANVGYAHFESGEFLKNAGRGGNSDFLYVEMTVSLF